MSALLGEIFGAVQAIQVASAENRVVARFRQLNDARRQSVLKERLFGDVFLGSLFHNAIQAGTGFILLLIGQATRPLHMRQEPPPVPFLVKTAEHRLELLEVRGLTYHYRSTIDPQLRVSSIENVNFSLPRGSFTVVTGRSRIIDNGDILIQ